MLRLGQIQGDDKDEVGSQGAWKKIKGFCRLKGLKDKIVVTVQDQSVKR